MTLSNEQSFRLKTRIQKLLVRNALSSLSRRHEVGSDLKNAAKDLLSDRSLLDEYYGTLVGIYCTDVDPSAAVGFDEESGTPILDSLIEFIKWMYESGFLELVLKLFFGMVLEDVDVEGLDMEVSIFRVADAMLSHQTTQSLHN